MEQKDMVHITAVTQVRPDGEKCTQAVIEYKEKIEPSMLGMDTFEVKDRTITGIEMEGNKVTLYLDEKDEAASTLCPGMPWKGTYASLKEAKVLVQQKKNIQTQDGRIIRKTDEWIESDQTCNKEEELFIQMAYQNQNYNLYIPKDYDPRKKYPLVQFIHDAGACGKDTRLALAQGTGALVWASPEYRKSIHALSSHHSSMDHRSWMMNGTWTKDLRMQRWRLTMCLICTALTETVFIRLDSQWVVWHRLC